MSRGQKIVPPASIEAENPSTHVQDVQDRKTREITETMLRPLEIRVLCKIYGIVFHIQSSETGIVIEIVGIFLAWHY